MKIQQKEKKRTNKLSARDKQLIALIAGGFNDFEISDFLKIKPQTIRQIVGDILKKTELCNRPQLIYWAVKNKVLD